MEGKVSLQETLDNQEKASFSGNLNKIFNGAMIVFLSAMVVLVFINAGMRYIFKTSLPVSEEYARFFFMWTVFLGTVAAFKDKQHVAVTILTDKLKGKSKFVVYIIAQVISLITLALILMGGIQYTISTSTYKTVATGINFGIIASGIVVMIAGAMILIIRDTIKTTKEQIKKGE
ncbi:TRAP transporter small permease subunit [Clostridium bovifaecis]|uniref:TRAP transporter small permease subunit n=1 Tax=Clostridium bovifaecis TaxID=2184719 RepID=A0A6I6FDX1_9CLOT|nr:TRAP transporter small permease subunit [Clostridium bovifaecis]